MTTTMNKNVRETHRLVLAQHRELSEALDQEKDPARAAVLVVEMQELLHRATLLQGLLFKEHGKKLSSLLKKVEASRDSARKAVRRRDKLNRVLESSSQFLKLVDQLIDVAKLL